MTCRFIKDPDSVLDYQWDWSTWLDTDTISSATVTVPSGITKDSQSNTTTTVTAWISGGSANTEYAIECEIVTAGGRTAHRNIIISVKER